ncbi:hypothetical protein SDC49_17835 [Lactobacillus sp. R2/2]|nr:hypothetical protein [Lactobacillus sp. R2/2]
MLNDPHLKVLYFEQNSSKVFRNTDIKGEFVLRIVITAKNRTNWNFYSL